MRLENLYTNFETSSLAQQAEYVAEYRARRAEDMLKTPTWPKPKKVSKSKRKVIQITPEETVIMKLLGLTRKEVVAMRELKQ